MVFQAAAEVYEFLDLGATSNCVALEQAGLLPEKPQCDRAHEDGESLQKDPFQVVQQ